mmetsp:Transcript_67060/g.119321  ORF Transcript_67060/g.119321 Transcript_67060/m.119321 type:complete len:174 (-) Transcript_67060:30-551(-)
MFFEQCCSEQQRLPATGTVKTVDVDEEVAGYVAKETDLACEDIPEVFNPHRRRWRLSSKADEAEANRKRWKLSFQLSNHKGEFEVVLKKLGDFWHTLGIVVTPDDDPRYLVVDSIWGPSLISQWNATKPEDQRVRSGDMITAVNGTRSAGEEMLQVLQRQEKGAELTLHIKRP